DSSTGSLWSLKPTGMARSISTKFFEFTIENSALERRFDRHHSPPDSHTDSGRDNGVFSRDDRSDHRAFSEMSVRHQSNVLKNARQTRDVAEHVRLIAR